MAAGDPYYTNEPTLTCSEVVERLPECKEKLRGDKCIRFAGHPDKHQDRYGMQWAPYVRHADIREILRSIFELTARPENRASWVKGTLQERMDKIRDLCIKAERKSDSWRERRVQELEEALRQLCIVYEDGWESDDPEWDCDAAWKQAEALLTNSEQIRKGAKHE